MIRAQYHFRRRPEGLCAWDVRGLIKTSATLPRIWLPLGAIVELDESYWANEKAGFLSCRDVVDHARLMLACDLGFPIILSSDGRVMDGMHRVCRALLEGRSQIEAVQFVHDPAPDFIGVHPDDLPYEDS